MALSASLFEMHSGATTGNVNGAGFNPANANFPTDLTTDSNTANTSAPIVSSATYNFDNTRDTAAYLYIKAGTNWLPGFYPIVSASGNKATINAAIGAGFVKDSATNEYRPTTVVGIASIGTPTAGTYGVNYSAQDTAPISGRTDFGALLSATTLTSATGGFGQNYVGNFYHQTTTGTGAFGVVGWYEIVSVTDANNLVLDRTPNSGTANVGCTGYIGGAGRLNALEDAFYEMVIAGSRIYFKGSGTHTLVGTVSTASTSATFTTPIWTIGFTSAWGDEPIGDNRPTIAQGANAWTYGTQHNFRNMIFTGTAASMHTANANGNIYINCRMRNSSTTAGRNCHTQSTDSSVTNCELVAQNGTALIQSTRGKAIGCWIRNSATGITTAVASYVYNCLIEGCTTAGYSSTINTGGNWLVQNTIYGREGKIGIGINLNANPSPSNNLVNNIVYGCTTGINISTAQQDSNLLQNNNLFNNTTDYTLINKGITDKALDPTFTGMAQVTGTAGAALSSSRLQDSTKNFTTLGVVVGDYVYAASGTATAGMYLVTAITTVTNPNDTLTLNNSAGTGAVTDVVYYVWITHNAAIGTNLKAGALPAIIGGSPTTNYMDIGAAQRVEPSGGSGMLFIPNMEGV